jgi:hypothetical protein
MNAIISKSKLFLGISVLASVVAFKLSPNIAIAELKNPLLTVQAQNKPNFTGTWRLNLEASRIGNRNMKSVYRKFLLTLNHKEPALSIKQEIWQDDKRTLAYAVTTDGRFHSLKLYGQPAIAGAKWQGNYLTMYLKRTLPEANDIQRETIRTVTLLADGKTMVAKVQVKDLQRRGYLSVGDEVWEKQ